MNPSPPVNSENEGLSVLLFYGLEAAVFKRRLFLSEGGEALPGYRMSEVEADGMERPGFHFGREGLSVVGQVVGLPGRSLASGWGVSSLAQTAVRGARGGVSRDLRSVLGEGLGRSAGVSPVALCEAEHSVVELAETRSVGVRGAGDRSEFLVTEDSRGDAHGTTGGEVDGSVLVAESSGSAG